MSTYRFTAACLLALTAGCAGEAPPPPAAPAHTAAPKTPAAPPPAVEPALPPEPAPPLDSAAWKAIEGKPAPCAGGEQQCIQVQLPADGYLSFDGTSPHDWGCGDFRGGRIVAEMKDRELHLRMDAGWRAGLSGGVCRALASLHGTGASGLLAAGTWLLVPDGRSMQRQSPYSPLHVRGLRFAAKGSR